MKSGHNYKYEAGVDLAWWSLVQLICLTKFCFLPHGVNIMQKLVSLWKLSPETKYSLFMRLFEVLYTLLMSETCQSLIFKSYPTWYNCISFNDNTWSMHNIKITFLYIVFILQICGLSHTYLYNTASIVHYNCNIKALNNRTKAL